MRKFDDVDYYGFAGVTEEEDKPAMMGANQNFLIIVDTQGVAVYMERESEEEYIFFQPMNYHIAKIVGRRLEAKSDLTPEFLQEWGFDLIS
jgi:hypothetical protein